MDNNTLQKLKEAITKGSNIGIAVGADPTVDAMGAALSLYLLLKAANKSVSIASPTEPIVELSSLVGINKVQKSLGGEAGDLVVSFPYVEGEIEKVSYTLEEGFLNIIVKASEQGLSFDEKDVRYVRGSGAVDLLFVVGTPRLSELEDVFDSQKLRDVRIVNIDNHENNQGFGDIVLASPKFSSVSEQMSDLVLGLGFRVDQDVAQNLLTGITTETKNFQSPKVTSLTFEVMAYLMKAGAARRQIEERRPISLPDNDRDQSRLDRDQSRLDRDQSEDARPRLTRPQNNQRPPMDRRPHSAGSGQAQDDRRQLDRRPEPSDRLVSDRQEDRRSQVDTRPSSDDRRGFDDPSASSGQGRQDDRYQKSNLSRDDQRRRDEIRRVAESQDQSRLDRDQSRLSQDDNASDDDAQPPMDWLTPKVYKGSSDVE